MEAGRERGGGSGEDHVRALIYAQRGLVPLLHGDTSAVVSPSEVVSAKLYAHARALERARARART